MKKCILAFAVLSGSFNVLGQSVSGGSITGNAEATFQYLNADPLIGATQPAEKGLLNSYMNVFYSSDHFKAGGRFESYLPRINGYPNRFDGTGLGMRYAGYVNDYIDVTIGNFYEQFGSGTIFRAYEDRNLGYDNAMDGARIILRPIAGVQLKGVYGNQRYSFQGGRVEKSSGVTRGFDAQFHINELTRILDSTGVDLTIGGAFVSKYQADNNDLYVLPENVGSYSGRINARYKKFTFNAEYTHKENDPSDDNGYIYNSGHAALINLGYSKRGLFGISVSAKSVDNMSYRSDRTKNLADLFINYLPAMNKTHTYNLVATLYPYATQPLGEIAFQTEVQYNIKKGKIGNKYDIPINFNYSTAYMPIKHTAGIIPGDSSRVTYVGRPFDKSDSLMWQDINVNVTYKFSKNLYIVASYFNIMLNNDISKISENATGIINAHIGVIETAWKINKKHSLRTEIQGLFTTEKKIPVLGFQTSKDKGNWATVVLEYNISPNWFFGFMDQYNYGNPNTDLRLHYAIGSVGWIKDATRVTLNYGRQRAGLFCVGGVCRFVPASNGLTLSITQSF